MRGDWVKNNETAGPVVVFVHGVLSSSETCWRHASGVYWPDIVAKDSDLNCLSVYVFNYQTGFFSGNYRLGDAVDALKEHIKFDKVLQNGKVIFVYHSMGGILVRKYLVERATELIDQNVCIGLFLLASPSLGSDYATWLTPLARVFGHSQADALRFSQSNAWLMDLDREFVNLKERGRLKLSGKELVEDKFIWLRGFWRKQVVEPFSGARYFGDPFKVPASDHLSIAKIESPDSIQHRLLRSFVLEWLRQNENLPPSNIRSTEGDGLSNPIADKALPTMGNRFLSDAEQPVGVIPNGAPPREAWAAYQHRMVSRATRNDWWKKPIPILASVEGEPARPAREAIQDWITGAEARHCVLLGEPGAGKTGLLTWTASVIAQREDCIALWVAAKRLHGLSEIDLAGLLPLCDPTPPMELLRSAHEREVFFILDGLDELTGAAEGGETIAANLLRRTLASLPGGWRVLASCRTPAFDALRSTVEGSLPHRNTAGVGGDHYDAAIARALGVGGNSVALIKLARVQANAAAA
jgi:pimeloyl-ACP methyl ester carboxylesterase